MIGNVDYVFGERHYKGSEVFTTLLHYYVVTGLCGDVHPHAQYGKAYNIWKLSIIDFLHMYLNCHT